MSTLDREEFRALRVLLHRVTGISLNDTKQELMRSRLQSRLHALDLDSYGAYYQHLVHADPDGAELREMVNAMTTNKTSFFREPYQFDFLRREVFPALAARARQGGPRRLRIWSAGCSTGAEPYTIAMLVRECLEPTWDVRILATDIDTEVLATAAEGVFEGAQLEGLDAQLLARHFRRGRDENTGKVKVRPTLRELIQFQQINLIEPFPLRGPFDMIFCRNVSIYFDRPTQIDVFGRLAALLVPDGYLFVGHSESLADMGLPLHPMRGNMHRKLGGGGATSAAAVPARPTTVRAGCAEVARAPAELTAELAGSIAVCVFEPGAPVGGVAHLADATEAAGPALAQLFLRLRGLGAAQDRLAAKVVAPSDAAVAAVRTALHARGVANVEHRVQPARAEVRFEPAVGRVRVTPHKEVA